MTTRTITIPTDHIDALRAIRSVIADAVGHPAREAAIEAIDQIASAEDVGRVDPDAYAAALEEIRTAGIVAAGGSSAPEFKSVQLSTLDDGHLPPDWYDGKPKQCPGVGKEPRTAYHGEMDGGGERLYRVHCGWCDKSQSPYRPMPEHTFIPVRPEDWTYAEGKVVQTFAGVPPGYVPTIETAGFRDAALCVCGRIATHTVGEPWCGAAECERQILAKLKQQARETSRP